MLTKHGPQDAPTHASSDHVRRCREAMQAAAEQREGRTVTGAEALAWFHADAESGEWCRVIQAGAERIRRQRPDLKLRVPTRAEIHAPELSKVFMEAHGWEYQGKSEWRHRAERRKAGRPTYNSPQEKAAAMGRLQAMRKPLTP